METNKQEVFADIGNWLGRQLTLNRILKPLHSILCGGFFFAGFRARRAFTNISHFVLFGGSATAPSQAVTAASQYRLQHCFITVFKSVSETSLPHPIFYHLPLLLCYLLGLNLYF